MDIKVFSALQTYADTHSSEESEARKYIIQATHSELQYADMLSGKQVAGLLRLLIQTGGYTRILEVGMFTGYATTAMAEVMPDNGHITTLEMNTLYAGIAKRGFKMAGLQDKITVIMGSARETVLQLSETYDLIFLDADKQWYPEYLRVLKPKLKSGGLLVADNVFWYGGVLENKDRKSQAINTFNKMLQQDNEMEVVMLGIRDGLSIARKR
ncbi:caffeoyl-CoA O-methyltransferase [Cyclonatronum proteinivorum]|uniref:Caffeoyl-CoA O-methyltransferase n=1 Tax=Cyclonatronum proteinivorum TaxID=1457365 RepID=A0A345UKQ6_9BACT|nr:O-methyltransferase [Cyclonatronum proteinivorum]AXJ01058.1 caffeoyl-CoA O-methyltransferase [Cyclonatronum proteinivorum]